jgi:hypothetical protein
MTAAEDALRDMNLFVFHDEAIAAINYEMRFSGDRAAGLRRDLLSLGAAEIEVASRFGAGAVSAPPPQEPLEVSHATARLAVTSLYCDIFCAPETEGVEPSEVAVFSGDIAKLELARKEFGLESWERVSRDEATQALLWLLDEWRSKGERYPEKVAAAHIQAVLWALKLERLVWPGETDTSVSSAVYDALVRQHAVVAEAMTAPQS